MKPSLSKALMCVCCLWALVGLILLGLAFHAVAINQYKDPVTFMAGIFFGIIALPLFFLSRSKTATQSEGRNPIIAGILWVAVVLFAVWGGWGLFNIVVSNL